ncbi:helix-turn-helix domain-containing protein, partial [Ferrovum myxofaciens]
MKRLQAFKYELQPNGEQARSMRRFAGSCRFVFNKA